MEELKPEEFEERIRKFQGNIQDQIMREYLIYYGVLPTVGASLAEKEKHHKEALLAVYEFGVRNGEQNQLSKFPANESEMVEKLIAKIKDIICRNCFPVANCGSDDCGKLSVLLNEFITLFSILAPYCQNKQERAVKEAVEKLESEIVSVFREADLAFRITDGNHEDYRKRIIEGIDKSLKEANHD